VLRNETKASNAEISSYGSDWSNVVLSYAQMFDPAYVTKKLDYYYNAPSTTNTDTSRYATMHDYAPVATDTRFSGALTYYNTHSNRTLGWVQWNYHISIPSSCTYYNPFTKVYSHVVFNPSKTTQLASVYNGATLVGSYNVPPQTTVTFTLPNPITSIGISKPYKTVALGGTVQLTGKGFDQYGAIYPLTGISWSVSGGGTIDQNGLFTSTSSLYPVIVTAKALGFTATDTLRSGSPSVLTTLVISPAMVSIPTNVTQQFTVSAKDQFGDPYTPVGAVWSASNGGVINGNGMFTAGNTGGLYEIKLTRGNVIAGALVAVKATPTNLALNKPATASTTNGVNNAAAGVDGNAGTRWESAAADNQTFSVDLQNTFDLTRIVLIWEAAYAKTYDVQVSSDGVTYTTIYSQFTGNGKTEDFPVSGTAKYVRIKCNQRATNYGFSFYELQVYGYPSPPTVVPSNIIIVPSTVSINTGGTRQFNAYGFDANYNAASISGGTWAINGGGTVNASGLVNATTFGGPFSINYASGSLTGNGSFSVSSNAMDCAGVQGGTAYYDACNKCAGGTTGVTPQSDPGKCIITHIVNNDLLINMTLYPNPFEGSFTIDVSEKTGTFEIVMTDLNGRVVYKSLVENPSEEIHLGSDLNAGMYFVKITSGSDYKNFKMVKF
jgi:hypothetical protein